jgi:DNA polymerase-2
MDSNIIEYVITEDGPEPTQKLKHKIDYDHYIKKQIQPIADSVLVFFNKNFEELLKGNKQSSLSNF